MRRVGDDSAAGRFGRPAAFVVAFLALAVSSPGTATEANAQETPEARLHALVNDHRDAAGCPSLLWHEPSATVAEERSADMVRRRYFDHRTPDGRTVFDLVDEAGIEAHGSIAENIALTQAGPASVMELWRESSPHRRNLDNCSFTHHGLGEREGVWTQILVAQPKPADRIMRRLPSTPRD